MKTGLRQGQERHPLLLVDNFLNYAKTREFLESSSRYSSKDTVDGPVLPVGTLRRQLPK